MNLSKVVAVFAASVLAAVVGWFGGGMLRDALAPSYETALGVVDAEVGAPVETASPTPSSTAVPSPTSSQSPSPTPEETEASLFCEGDPPADDCDCDLQNGEWVWVCELPTTDEPSPVVSPTL
jgi:hypothetical protein